MRTPKTNEFGDATRGGSGGEAPPEEELSRLRKALETLATGDEGSNVYALIAFVRSMMEVASRYDGFQRWLDGDLGIEIHRRREGGVTFRALADTRRRLVEIFAVPFARIPFRDVWPVAENTPELLGPAFVLIEDDAIAISLVRYVDEAWSDDTGPNSDVWSAGLRQSGIVSTHDATPVSAITYDPEATVIAAPSTDLLRQLRR